MCEARGDAGGLDWLIMTGGRGSAAESISAALPHLAQSRPLTTERSRVSSGDSFAGTRPQTVTDQHAVGPA